MNSYHQGNACENKMADKLLNSSAKQGNRKKSHRIMGSAALWQKYERTEI